MKPVRFDTRYLNGKGSFGEYKGISSDFIIVGTYVSSGHVIRQETYFPTRVIFQGFNNFLTWIEI